MEHSREILDELKSISELIALLPRDTPYKAPPGYFDTLSETIAAGIDKTGETFLLIKPKLFTPYIIPEHYFNELPFAILTKIKSEECYDNELEMLSPALLQVKQVSTYKSPPGYFEQFAATMLERIELESASEIDELSILSPLLVQMKRTVPFTLPPRYFDEFPSDITAGLHAVDYVNQELESYPPVTNDIKIANVYQVPAGYFDNLGNGLLNNVKNRKKTSVITIDFNKKVLRFAVAALITGIMSVGTWIFYNNHTTTKIGNELGDIQKLSSDEMIHYLESTPVISVENFGTASVTMKEEDVNDLFSDVPDMELQQYLEQNAASRDLIIN